MRSLRPFAFALLWLGLFEGLLRLFCAPDPRVVRDPEHPYGCFADDELAALVAVRTAEGRAARPPGGLPRDVVLIGDSVLASVENPPGMRLADALRPALQKAQGPSGPPVRVWTLAAGGARASDVYGMVRRVERALRAGGRGTEGVLVVVSSNVIFFSQRHRQPAMAYPCLMPELTSAADDANIYTTELRARLLGLGAADSASGRLEHRLLAAATAHVYLLQQRRHLAEALFGGPPRLALRERLQQLWHRSTSAPTPGTGSGDAGVAADRPWTERGLTAAQFASSYDFVPLDSPDAVNRLWTDVLARWLGKQHDLRVLAVLVPQNHALLGALAEGPAYEGVGTWIAAAFGQAGIPYVSYDHDPAIVSAHFLDLDHLTAAGNRALAARLAVAIAPWLRAAEAR